MNPAALEIYSFLMAQNLEFSRICHPAYHTRAQWKQALKKSRTQAVCPVSVVCQEKESSKTVLFLAAESLEAQVCSPPTGLLPAGAAETAALCQRLRCLPHTLSPLALLFDAPPYCGILVQPELYREKLWCLSPCSEESSVLIPPETLLRQFLPAAKQK